MAANTDSTTIKLKEGVEEEEEQKQQNPDSESSDSDSETDSEEDSDSDYDSDSDSDSDIDEAAKEEKKRKRKEEREKRREMPVDYVRPSYDSSDEEDNSPEANIRRLNEVVESRRLKRMFKEKERMFRTTPEEEFNFPIDHENWQEKDLKEIWAEAPRTFTKTGWDPVWADEKDWDAVRKVVKEGGDPPIAPFYVPFRKYYPIVPDNHHDIATPKAVIEELDRIEEFLKWVSYIFPDGSSYEGTVWDDKAHGKGVYVAEEGEVRYEGEWLQNDMEGHGVVEVDIPDIEPVPGSSLEAEMRAEGRIISRDFMSPEDREWLEMDIEDSIRLAAGDYEIPFWENEEWITQFGEKPETGRYRYAGQWKHGRMHGCGVYEVNERVTYGRFYFGELLEEEHGCDADISAMHAGIADVAAAKARMFVNKPDGMVREKWGPYSDPQHPYLYEEDDVWMAPGFINQFYEVPDHWKTYVKEVDQERQMWLNSFYKAPFRLAMPAELEHWWSKDHSEEFVLINKEPEPDPEDPSKQIYTEDPLILHVPSGRLINYIQDEEHGLRLFWQPPLKDGEDVDPSKAEFLPLGYDEFFGVKEPVEVQTFAERLIKTVQNTLKPVAEKITNWAEEQKKAAESNMKLIEAELAHVEAEITLEELLEDMEKEKDDEDEGEENEDKKGNSEANLCKEDDTGPFNQTEKASVEIEKASAKKVLVEKEVENEEEEGGEEEDDEEDEDEDGSQTSFGSVIADQGMPKDEQKGKKAGKSPFSSTSLSFASFGITSMVPSKLQQSFLSWKEKRTTPQTTPPSGHKECSLIQLHMTGSVIFPRNVSHNGSLRADLNRAESHTKRPKSSPVHSVSRLLCTNSKARIKEKKSNSSNWLHRSPESERDSILSLQIPVFDADSRFV